MSSDSDVPSDRSARIAALNDAFRISGKGGTVLATAGLTAHGEQFMSEVIAALRAFSSFTPDNDPHGEHDFGVLVIQGQRVFWKIDYYDQNQEYGSEDPTNPDITTRVLTLMLPEEY